MDYGRALAVLKRLEQGESILSVVDSGFDIDVDFGNGIVATARPYYKDGEVHLEGFGERDGRRINVHVSAHPEDVEAWIREALEKNVPMRLARWWKSTFTRIPTVRRTFGSAEESRALGPSRLLARKF